MSTETSVAERVAQATSEPIAQMPPHVEIMPDELIVGNRQRVKQCILDRLDAGDRKFVFDFGACGYVDSPGLGVLVSCSKRIRDRQGRLIVCGLNEDLTTLFDLTGMTPLFTIVKDRAAALREIAR